MPAPRKRCPAPRRNGGSAARRRRSLRLCKPSDRRSGFSSSATSSRMHLRPFAFDADCTIAIMGDLNNGLISRTGHDNRALQAMIGDLGLVSCADARARSSGLRRAPPTVFRVFRVRELAGRGGSASEAPPLNPPRRSKVAGITLRHTASSNASATEQTAQQHSKQAAKQSQAAKRAPTEGEPGRRGGDKRHIGGIRLPTPRPPCHLPRPTPPGSTPGPCLRGRINVTLGISTSFISRGILR